MAISVHLGVEDYVSGIVAAAVVAALLFFSLFRTQGSELLGLASVVGIAAFAVVMLAVSVAAEVRAMRAAK